MFKAKRLLCQACTVIMFASALAGCNGTKVGIKEEDQNQVPKDSYEINWYFMGDTLRDATSVEAKVNDYLKDKINATIKLNRLPSNQYYQKMSIMIASGEYYDICFTANWMGDYRSNIVNGAWLPLDDYFDKYLPKTKKLLTDDILNAVKVNGHVYAVPAMKELASQIGWVYRKDIAEKYNIDMDKIKTIEELEPVLRMIKEKEPDMQYPIDWTGDRTPSEFTGYAPLCGCAGVFSQKYEGKVFSYPETPEFEQAAKLARKLYEDGLIKKDVLTANDFDQRLKDGKTFVFIEHLKPGKANELSVNLNFPLAQSPVTPIVLDGNAGGGSMMAISTKSKNPVRCMRFLELFNNDKYLNNLIIYGIEGKHYKKLDGDYVEVIPNGGYTLAGSQWMMGNVFLNYLVKGEDPDKMQKLAEFNKDAAKPQHYGFSFNPDPVQQQISACNNVINQYQRQLLMGAVPLEPTWTEFKNKLKAAGIDEVKKEVQRQFDQFRAAKK